VLARKSQKLVGQRDPESLAQRPDIVKILIVEFVARVEFHQPLRRDAPDWIAVDRASSGQVFAPVSNAMHVVAGAIQGIGMDIEFAFMRVPAMPRPKERSQIVDSRRVRLTWPAAALFAPHASNE
jgi:hypothetical protein